MFLTRPAAHRLAVLHEFRVAEICEEGVKRRAEDQFGIGNCYRSGTVVYSSTLSSSFFLPQSAAACTKAITSG